MTHYDKYYFSCQRVIGAFGGEMNASKFHAFVKPSDTVLDFGCGGGFILESLCCSRRIGIEIIPEARNEARRKGIGVFDSVEEVPDALVDVLISHHALEHVENPLPTLVKLRRTVKAGSSAVVLLCPANPYCAHTDLTIYQHLFTWSPMCLGNLLTKAGYCVTKSKPLFSRWPPGIIALRQIAGLNACRLVSSIYGHLNPSLSQIRAVCRV